MRKFSFILIVFLLVAATIGTTYYISTKNESNQQQLSIIDAFNSSGAKMIANELYFFVRANNKFKDLESLKAICGEVYKSLDIDNYSRNSVSTDTMIKTDFLGATKDGVKISAMASIVGNKTSAADKYITIDAIGEQDGEALLLRDKIESVFKKLELDTNVNSCITGTYDGNLQDSQLESICRKILNDSDAKKVNSLRQENVISVSAFSPMIRDRLNIDGKSVNLSLAVRYNKNENKTYLWVATPIVNAEY